MYIQEKLLDKYRSSDLVLSGDERCNSPDKSAKFCTDESNTQPDIPL